MVLLVDIESLKSIITRQRKNDCYEKYKKFLTRLYGILLSEIEIKEVILIDFKYKFGIPDIPKYIKKIIADLNSIRQSKFIVECSKTYGSDEFLYKTFDFDISSIEPWVVNTIKVKYLHVNYIRHEEGYIVYEFLRIHLDSEKVIFFSELLTQEIIPVLLVIKDKIGFRYSSFDDKTLFQNTRFIEINKCDEYLENTFFLGEAYPSNIFLPFSSWLRIPTKYQKLISEHPNIGLNEQLEINLLHETNLWVSFRNCIKGVRKKVLLEGGDRFLSSKFIEEIQGHVKEYIIQDCSSGTYEIKKTKRLLVFKNIELLPKKELFDLVATINRPVHKDKIIILQSNSIIDDFPFELFEKISVPTFEYCRNNLHVFFWLISNQKKIFTINKNDKVNQEIEQYYLSIMKVYNTLLFQAKSLDNLSNAIKFVQPILNPKRITADFLADFEEYLTIKCCSDVPTVTEAEYDFEIIHEKDADTDIDSWTVKDKKNDRVYRGLPYKNDFAFVLMMYFIKFKEVLKTNKIDTEVLYQTIKVYQNKTPGNLTKGAKHNIDEAFREYFLMLTNSIRYKKKYKKNPSEEIKTLRVCLKVLFEEYFIISKTESTLRAGINVKIIDDELMHFIMEKKKQEL